MEIIDYDVDNNGLLVHNSANASINILGSAGLGYNAPQIVNINGVDGFLKDSSNSMSSFDKYEYLISKLGKYLGIKTANEYLVRDNDKTYLFSASVAKKDDKLIMASSLKDELINTGIPMDVLLGLKEQIDSFNNDLESNGMRVSPEQIEFAINTFITKIHLLKPENEEEIIRDYIRMCFFDTLIGNKDRNTNNYGLVKNSNGSYSFAPLFDSSTLFMPKVSDELCNINGYFFERKSLLKYLLNTYPQYLDSIFESNIENAGEKMTIVSKEILNEKDYEIFKSIVLDKLNNNFFDIIKSQSF
jgi:hypothetical protein